MIKKKTSCYLKILNQLFTRLEFLIVVNAKKP